MRPRTGGTRSMSGINLVTSLRLPPRTMTIVAVAGPVTDPRAHALRERYHRLFGAPELPVPVEAIAEDLLGLYVAEAEDLSSGLLLPAERRVVVNAGEPPPRRRFTLAHEVGH